MSKITLLYAEDEIQTRQTYIDYLQDRYDFNYIEANDGEEALALFKQHKPEIIITDINMPKMDGLTFVEHIRKSSPHTKIIILSADDDREKLMKAFDLDVVNYLLKPVTSEKLCSTLDRAVLTLPDCENKKDVCQIDNNTRWNHRRKELYCFGEAVPLSQYEKRLLSVLCEHKGLEVSSLNIFAYVWNDIETEFSMDSIRTLVKKLRKKLPDGALTNGYGGFYKLV